ncbi:MAG: bacteriohemerythrin [Campylobacteraceae bacterium]|jgi:hemerythrin|nr:bacteriohemerythrin [Campylobacteraceae bacterium]
MAYWDWSPSYELGINVIDKQHQRIVEYINELQDVLKTRDKERIAATIVGIADYTVSHFAFEESLMSEAGYPMLAPHKKVHEAFIQTVGKYQSAFREGNDITGQLMAELQIWLTHHILNDDKDYSPFVKKMLEDKARVSSIQRTAKKKSWFARLFG